ncbi:MAG: DUF58 domain-containing protein [Candidatus Omnitrophota bacterium]|nr:DUF58 domain-containing protein [Candidatus Omnitrophota bacterium]
MISKDIIKKIRRIQITTSRKVTDIFAGQYQSVFKGVGMEFDEVREYMPGDEIRSIDWNVTARMGHPYIKKFSEERELTIMILLDVSMSCLFGTGAHLKRDIAAEICSVIAFSAIQNNDNVGMITFTDRVEKFIPPRKGLRHVLRVVREAIYNQPEGKGTDIKNILEYLNNVTTRRTITFLVSDFLAPDFKKTLSITNKRHDVIAVNIIDPSEQDLPEAGIMTLEDAETGEIYYADTGDNVLRENYRKEAADRFEERKKMFRSVNVDSVDIITNRSYVDPLVRFFRARERRMRVR